LQSSFAFVSLSLTHTCLQYTFKLGAGLGLVGIVVHLMTAAAESCHGAVCITDGDSDALVSLRENVARNTNKTMSTTNSVSSLQLIWGKDNSTRFLERHHEGQQFDVVLASDILYAECIIVPLWETVDTLLHANGVFILAFAKRKVPVSIESVLESACKAGFEYTGGNVENEPDIFIYSFVRRLK
jgi:predicted nicotinamide N-methyase